MSSISLTGIKRHFAILPSPWEKIRSLLRKKSTYRQAATRPMRFKDRGTGGFRWVEVAETTGPLNSMYGRKVLLVVDLENWRASARNLGCNMDYFNVRQLIAAEARKVEAHAVFSARPGDERWHQVLSDAGYVCHSNPIETVSTAKGSVTHSNSDNWIAGVTMHLRASSNADAVVIGTGDGRLGVDIARMLQQYHRSTRTIVTMSLAGSTSRQLQVGGDHPISANLEIGLDCLQEQ